MMMLRTFDAEIGRLEKNAIRCVFGEYGLIRCTATNLERMASVSRSTVSQKFTSSSSVVNPAAALTAASSR